MPSGSASLALVLQWRWIHCRAMVCRLLQRPTEDADASAGTRSDGISLPVPVSYAFPQGMEGAGLRRLGGVNFPAEAVLLLASPCCILFCHLEAWVWPCAHVNQCWRCIAPAKHMCFCCVCQKLCTYTIFVLHESHIIVAHCNAKHCGIISWCPKTPDGLCATALSLQPQIRWDLMSVMNYVFQVKMKMDGDLKPCKCGSREEMRGGV